MLGYQQKKTKYVLNYLTKTVTIVPVIIVQCYQYKKSHGSNQVYIYIYICNVNLFSSDKNNNNIYNKTDTLINRYSKIGEYSCTHENFLLIYHDYKNQYECKTK